MQGVDRMTHQVERKGYEAATWRVSDGEGRGEHPSAEREAPRGELKGVVLRPCRPEGRLYE